MFPYSYVRTTQTQATCEVDLHDDKLPSQTLTIKCIIYTRSSNDATKVNDPGKREYSIRREEKGAFKAIKIKDLRELVKGYGIQVESSCFG